MNSNQISIGEMAKLGNISTATLRHYDKIGLLKPVYKDDISGYRFYDIKQNEDLDKIQCLKELGFSLEEISKILNENSDIENIYSLLDTRKHQILEDIDKKLVLLRMVENFIALIADKDENSYLDSRPFIDYQKERYGWVSETYINKEFSLDEFEIKLADLRKEMYESSIPFPHLFSIGTVKRIHNYSEILSFPKYLFVSVPVGLKEYSNMTLKEGFYASIYIKNCTKEKYIRAVNILTQYMKEKEMQYEGELIEDYYFKTSEKHSHRETNMMISLHITSDKKDWLSISGG